MKKCFKCNIEKPLSEFYIHKAMGDGHLGKCKICTQNDTQKRTLELSKNPNWVESERARGRKKYHRLYCTNPRTLNPQTKKESIAKHKEKYPEKYRAKCLNGNAKPLIKGNHLHHWSYNIEHAKDVIELMPKDHYTAHRFMVYDQERKMYRKLTGELLDTKEAHENYIRQYF